MPNFIFLGAIAAKKFVTSGRISVESAQSQLFTDFLANLHKISMDFKTKIHFVQNQRILSFIYQHLLEESGALLVNSTFRVDL